MIQVNITLEFVYITMNIKLKETLIFGIESVSLGILVSLFLSRKQFPGKFKSAQRKIHKVLMIGFCLR